MSKVKVIVTDEAMETIYRELDVSSTLPSQEVWADVFSKWLESTLHDDLETIEATRLGVKATRLNQT
jgi:hypothetical protein